LNGQFSVLKTFQTHQDDIEDDEEIKKIIMNNLNEKLKLTTVNSKQNHKYCNPHHIHSNNGRLRKFRNNFHRTNEIIETSSHSSFVSDEPESTSGSENDVYQSKEYFRSNQRRNLQQPCLNVKQHNKRKEPKFISSTSTSTSNENEVNSDEFNCQNLKINSQKINCKYCRSLTSFAKNKKIFYSTPKHLLNKEFTDYGIYSNVSRLNKGHCDERIYAYDNFDCINECIKEENENQSNFNMKKENLFKKNHVIIKDEFKETEESQNETETETEAETDNEKGFSSILVEDGFIRMSSPVYTNEDFGDIENIRKKELNHANIQSRKKKDFNREKNNFFLEKHIQNQNFLSNFKNLVVREDQSYKEVKIFPNVGSSPLPENFLNSCEANDLSDELDDQDPQEEDSEDFSHLINKNKRSDKQSINKFLNMSESSIQKLLDNENFDLNGIIHYSRNSNGLNNENVSLSDEDDILVEDDENEENNDDEHDFNAKENLFEDDNFENESQFSYIQIEKNQEGKNFELNKFYSLACIFY
jgi:hypothetical protein